MNKKKYKNVIIRGTFKRFPHLALKVDFLVEMDEFLHPFHRLHTGVTFFDDLRRQIPTW